MTGRRTLGFGASWRGRWSRAHAGSWASRDQEEQTVEKRHQLPGPRVVAVKASMCKIQSLQDMGWEGDRVRKKKGGRGRSLPAFWGMHTLPNRLGGTGVRIRRAWEELRQGRWNEVDKSGIAMPRPISLVGAPGEPGLQRR